MEPVRLNVHRKCIFLIIVVIHIIDAIKGGATSWLTAEPHSQITWTNELAGTQFHCFPDHHYCTDSGSKRQHTRAKLECSYPGWVWVGGSGAMSFIFICVNSWTKNALRLTQVRNHLSKTVLTDSVQWEAGAAGMVWWLECLWWYPDELDVGSVRRPNHPAINDTHKDLLCRLHLSGQLAHRKHVGCCHLTSLNALYGKHSKVQLSCMSHKVICACTKVPIETAMEWSPDDEHLWTWWHSSNDSWTKRKEGTLVLKPKGRHNGIHICPFLSLSLSASVQAATTSLVED